MLMESTPQATQKTPLRLLIITQIVDRKDPALGFFARWIEELALRTEQISVICLKKGEYTLPENVAVVSLGKEQTDSASLPHLYLRLRYILRFYRALFRARGTYDVVFVHMNEEYVLLAGLWWRLVGTPVFLWRNHYAGSPQTHVAAFLATRVFCTSRYSYTARFAKTKIMPVGVDVDSVHLDEAIDRVPRSILFLARFDKSKRPELLVEALAMLHVRGVRFTATFVGGPTEATSMYPNEVKALAEARGIGSLCTFTGAVPNTETYRYYRSHEIFVNCSKSGMLDKTIFKAAAAGCLALSSSEDVAQYVDASCIFKDNDAADLSRALEYLLESTPERRTDMSHQFAALVEQNTLSVLADKLTEEMSAKAQ